MPRPQIILHSNNPRFFLAALNYKEAVPLGPDKYPVATDCGNPPPLLTGSSLRVLGLAALPTVAPAGVVTDCDNQSMADKGSSAAHAGPEPSARTNSTARGSISIQRDRNRDLPLIGGQIGKIGLSGQPDEPQNRQHEYQFNKSPHHCQCPLLPAAHDTPD